MTDRNPKHDVPADVPTTIRGRAYKQLERLCDGRIHMKDRATGRPFLAIGASGSPELVTLEQFKALCAQSCAEHDDTTMS